MTWRGALFYTTFYSDCKDRTFLLSLPENSQNWRCFSASALVIPSVLPRQSVCMDHTSIVSLGHTPERPIILIWVTYPYPIPNTVLVILVRRSSRVLDPGSILLMALTYYIVTPLFVSKCLLTILSALMRFSSPGVAKKFWIGQFIFWTASSWIIPALIIADWILAILG